ncbi:MAG TPA: hypothetical protein PLE12_06720 [Propionicimonas sp.]|jgi:hypothetical protein|nr:hypothetical protein [Propionicimonas sp.]
MKRLTAATAAITVLVLGGCTGTTQATTPQPTVAPATITPTPDPSRQQQEASLNAEPTPAACGVDDKPVALLERDWQRVVDSVGLKSQRRHAKALADRVQALAVTAADCPGGEFLRQMQDAAAAISARAVDGAAPYDDLTAFRKAGNSWLTAVGRRPSLLG